jgi:TRAP-type C4-dicarboxylate transport system permease large subunit
VAPRPAAREWATAGATAAFVVGLLIAVTLGYLYAVEAAAAGGVVLVLFGLATRTLTRSVLREVLRDTMAVTGALFALLVGATVFTLILRAYGTDRWVAAALVQLPGGAPASSPSTVRVPPASSGARSSTPSDRPNSGPSCPRC